MISFRQTYCRLGEMTAPEWHKVILARQAVFVVEQDCVYADADEHDEWSSHLVFWDGVAVAAYLRLVDPGHKFEEPSIGRVMTAGPYRGTGLGRALMLEGLNRSSIDYPGSRNRIGAQLRLQGFYESLGFERVSDVYDEDGIPHVLMLTNPLHP